ncbi:MAG: DUF4982 domain-containing protein [Lachnospiraceae bacterium]|nr:DUF4982 domain-containing protein [Lachnospiraceae bacterium]
MRRTCFLSENWTFEKPGEKPVPVTLPHTWNNIDGQDGGNDYLRCTCTYRVNFDAPSFDPASECVRLSFDGVGISAKVSVNGEPVATHEGGYSRFTADITQALAGKNELVVEADNSVNDRIYPQKADFTFYGGIYRAVELQVVPKTRFDGGKYAGRGLRVTPKVNGKDASVDVTAWVNLGGVAASDAEVRVSFLDQEGKKVSEGTAKVQAPAEGKNAVTEDMTIQIKNAHRWDGVADPYLYTAQAELLVKGVKMDEVCLRFGVREYRFDEEKGFFLNGRSYPLHGVSRHQDRKALGNAITKEMHKEDIDLIREMGANSIRLAHYQHDQYFYDLCDEYGMVVWAEIPYISEHMPNGRANTVSQMKELIIQNHHHACIVCWGISNEITISTKDTPDMLDNHRLLNDLCHKMDPSRETTLACYAMCSPFSKVVHEVSDLVGYNLYLGWYVPGLWLNDAFLGLFHKFYPKRRLCYSEYGAEGMPNLHSAKPRRGDHTEEYQAVYHEYMLKCFEKFPWMWGTYVWNMYDFAADARDQGGEPGMNHKGLITFDRKTKKDSFYIYKAYWCEDPFVHICSKRFADRTEDHITVKVYSNQKEVTLFVNGNKQETKQGSHVFTFEVPMGEGIEVKAVSGACEDCAVFKKVSTPNPSYTLKEAGDKGANWTEKK